MLQPIALPVLTGSIQNQWSEMRNMPAFNSRTIFALPPRPPDIQEDMVFEDALHRRVMADTNVETDELVIYKRLSHMIDCLNMLLATKVDQRQSKWYEINSQMLRMMILAVLPNIIGVDLYNANAMYIHDLLGMPMVPRHFAAVCSRQVGKTITTCIVAALLLLGGSEQVVVDFFAQSGKTAHNNVSRARNLVTTCTIQFPQIRKWFRLVRGTVKEGLIYERVRYDGVVSTATLQARSANGDNTRGEMNDVTFFDEFGFYPIALLTQAEMTRTAREGIATIWITTHSSNDKAGTLTVDIVHDPDKFFGNGLVFESVFICWPCRMSRNAMGCRHRIDVMPLWRDIFGSMQQIKAAAGNSAKTEVATRELLGMVPSDNTRAIPETMISDLFSIPHIRVEDAVATDFKHSNVYLAVDPNCGSRSSAVAALVGLVGHNGQQLWLGGEYFITIGTDLGRTFGVIAKLVADIYAENPDTLCNKELCWEFEGNNNENVSDLFTGVMCDMCRRVGIRISSYTMESRAAFQLRNVPPGHEVYKGSVWTDINTKQIGLSNLLSFPVRFSSPFMSSCVESFMRVEGSLATRKSNDDAVYKTNTSTASPWEYISKIMRDQLAQLVHTPTGNLSGKKGNQQDDFSQVILMFSHFSVALQLYYQQTLRMS